MKIDKLSNIGVVIGIGNVTLAGIGFGNVAHIKARNVTITYTENENL
ncbi:MAG: hypothetical protein JW806_00420 [Sedimentisphaerales bacterium]|nr:hypothetical protein [Sedimentisphaerales bacterium]